MKYVPQTKPRLSKCGTHWTVEWNRRGDYYPQHRCMPTWEDALRWITIVVKNEMHA